MCISSIVLWFYYVYCIVYDHMHAFVDDLHSLQVRANIVLFALSDFIYVFFFLLLHWFTSKYAICNWIYMYVMYKMWGLSYQAHDTVAYNLLALDKVDTSPV